MNELSNKMPQRGIYKDSVYWILFRLRKRFMGFEGLPKCLIYEKEDEYDLIFIILVLWESIAVCNTNFLIVPKNTAKLSLARMDGRTDRHQEFSASHHPDHFDIHNFISIPISFRCCKLPLGEHACCGAILREYKKKLF